MKEEKEETSDNKTIPASLVGVTLKISKKGLEEIDRLEQEQASVYKEIKDLCWK